MPASRHYEALWRELRRAEEPTTTRRLCVLAGCGSQVAMHHLKKLERAGLVVRYRAGRGNQWALTDLARFAGVAPPPLLASGRPDPRESERERLWKALRMAGWTTAADLADQVSFGEVAVPVTRVRDWLNTLARAGYLHTRRERVCLRPSRNTGPAAPRAVRAVLDPNEGRFVWPCPEDVA